MTSSRSVARNGSRNRLRDLSYTNAAIKSYMSSRLSKLTKVQILHSCSLRIVPVRFPGNPQPRNSPVGNLHYYLQQRDEPWIQLRGLQRLPLLQSSPCSYSSLSLNFNPS